LNTKTAKIKTKKWYKKWKIELSEYKYLIILSMIFLVFSELTGFYASRYVDKISVVSVPDIILDNIPTLNLEILFMYVPVLLFLLVLAYTVLFRVKEIHKVAILFSLLIAIRGAFITLTHLGAPVDAKFTTDSPLIFQFMTFRNDLFFSGHAAMPFMAFLIFRKEKIGKVFLVLTIISSATVLLMHVHYSIDVFSAFFITYGIYTFGQWLLNKEFWNRLIVQKV
jgi:hypothetical protein